MAEHILHVFQEALLPSGCISGHADRLPKTCVLIRRAKEAWEKRRDRHLVHDLPQELHLLWTKIGQGQQLPE